MKFLIDRKKETTRNGNNNRCFVFIQGNLYFSVIMIPSELHKISYLPDHKVRVRQAPPQLWYSTELKMYWTSIAIPGTAMHI